MNNRKKALISLGFILTVVGLCFIVSVFVFFIKNYNGNTHQFIAPGFLDYEAKEPGKYHLWYDYETIFNRRTFTLEKSIPSGLTIQLQSKEDGSWSEFFPDHSLTIEGPSGKRTSVGYFVLGKKGSYLGLPEKV